MHAISEVLGNAIGSPLNKAPDERCTGKSCDCEWCFNEESWARLSLCNSASLRWGWVHAGFVVLPVLPELANLLKAIELIKGLQEKVEADGVKQEEAYKKYKDTQSWGRW